MVTKKNPLISPLFNFCQGFCHCMSVKSSSASLMHNFVGLSKRISDSFNANLLIFLTNYNSFLGQHVFNYAALIGKCV